MMMKRKDMTKTQLEGEAKAVNLTGRSTMTKATLVGSLNRQEEIARMNRFPGEQPLTPKQARRVMQKMNRQR
jgi:GTP-binding protein EngB required for normal cell division